MPAPPFVILNHAGQWDVVIDDFGECVAGNDVAPDDAKAAALTWLGARYEFDCIVWEPAGATAFLGRVVTSCG